MCDPLVHPFRDISLPKQRKKMTTGRRKSHGSGNDFQLPVGFWMILLRGGEGKGAMDHQEKSTLTPHTGISQRSPLICQHQHLIARPTSPVGIQLAPFYPKDNKTYTFHPLQWQNISNDDQGAQKAAFLRIFFSCWPRFHTSQLSFPMAFNKGISADD